MTLRTYLNQHVAHRSQFVRIISVSIDRKNSPVLPVLHDDASCFHSPNSHLKAFRQTVWSLSIRAKKCARNIPQPTVPGVAWSLLLQWRLERSGFLFPSLLLSSRCDSVPLHATSRVSKWT